MMKTILMIMLWLPFVSAQAQDLAVYEARGPVKQIRWAKEYGGNYPIPYFYGTYEFNRRGRDKGFSQRYCAERDSHGNWTKRQFTSNRNTRVYVEERTITYYR